MLENDDYSKLVKFGFIREGAAPIEPVAELKNSSDASAAPEKAGEVQTTALLAETLSDDAIEKLIAERVAVRQGGNYGRSDEIRASLLKAGVILEDTKAGTRWKRK